MARVIRAALLAVGFAFAAGGAGAQQPATAEMRSLDEQVQEIKTDVLGIAAELNRLEEKLLYPSNTQLAVFVSIAEGETFRLDSMQINIDGQLATHFLYSFKELDALQHGGVQRVYTGNVPTGGHQIEVAIAGKTPGGDDFNSKETFSFDKGVEPKLLGIALENSRLDQTYNTPALSKLFLLADTIDWMVEQGGLDWCVKRCDANAEIVYGWADSRDFATPFVTDPAAPRWRVFTPGTRRIDHTHHARKYADRHLPENKAFHFQLGDGRGTLVASNLAEFYAAIGTVALSAIRAHLTARDFSRWAAGVLGDETLARGLRKIERTVAGGGSPNRGEILALIERLYDI